MQPNQEPDIKLDLDWEWPKTAFGTVCWELVFENPNNGLVPVALATLTPEELKDTTLQIIAHLFPRDADDVEIAKFTKQFNLLIPDDTPDSALPALKDGVALILREIRDFRMERARDYELSQMEAPDQTHAELEKAENGVFERRAVVPESLLTADALKARKIPLAIGAAAIAAGMAFFLSLGDDPLESVTAMISPPTLEAFLVEMKQASADKTTRTHVFGGLLHVSEATGRTTVTASGVPRVICMSATRNLLRSGTILINGQYSQKLEMEQLTRLCAAAGTTAQLTWRPEAAKTTNPS